MITEKELCKYPFDKVNPKKIARMRTSFLPKINKVRALFGKSMICTSGVRTLADHLEIYRKKGITDPKKIPMKSKHLETIEDAFAGDFGGPNVKALQQWCLDNVKALEEIGLWCEDFKYTPTWVHFQDVPPASGKRFFIP